MKLRPLLEAIYACDAALDWVGGRTVCERTYEACPHGDWLTFILDRAYADGVLTAREECDRMRMYRHRMRMYRQDQDQDLSIDVVRKAFPFRRFERIVKRLAKAVL